MAACPATHHKPVLLLSGRGPVLVAAALAVASLVVSAAPAQAFAPQASTNVQVSVAGDQTCGLRADTTITCWGLTGLAVPPTESGFISLAAGDASLGSASEACAVKSDHSVVCWGGSNFYGAVTPPAGAFASVSAGLDYFCGIKTDQTVACWGNNADSQATAPPGTFLSVSAGFAHACGVQTDNTVVCWGRNYNGQASPPSGMFASVSAGWTQTCGVKTNGTLACWGATQGSTPVGAFTSVSSGVSYACAVKTSGGVTCWGDNTYNESSAPSGTFASVSTDKYIIVDPPHTCGVQTDGNVVCWGNDNNGQSFPPAPGFVSVSVGQSHLCGVRSNGTVNCWGNNDNGQLSVPAGTFSSVSAGGSNTCGLRTDNTAKCWGSNSSGESTPPSGTFLSLSVGQSGACGVRPTHSVVCWGNAGSPGSAQFDSVSVGGSGNYTCGLKTSDHTVACSGTIPTDVPQAGGTFLSVSVGTNHACGVRTDQTVACWGSNDSGQSVAPAGAFLSVSAGQTQSCALKTDNTVACWGDIDVGDASPPSGTFTSVSAGYLRTCGVRTDGVFQCWGVDAALGGPMGPGPSASLPAPGPPTNVRAHPGTTSSSTRGPINVSYDAGPDNGATITQFTATCRSNNGGATRTGTHTGSTAATIVVNNATLKKTYTCKVTETNAKGTSLASAPSTAVTVGAPGTSGKPSVTRLGAGHLKVSFSTPPNNGARIRSYKAVCRSSNGGIPRGKTGAASPLGLKTLTPGKKYTCTVVATNSRGTGRASVESASITA
jgi:hypothetical protein